MFDPSNYKAVLFDVDKTLSNSHKEITPRTRAAIKSLQDKGYIVGVCTGRHFATIHKTLSEIFPSESLHITAGGGQIIHTTGKVFFEKRMPNETARQLYAIAQKYDCRFVIQNESQIYGNEKALERHSTYVLKGNTQEVMQPVTELQDWSVPLIVIGGISNDLIKEISKLSVSIKSMVSYVGEPYADITALGVTKGKAIEEWCAIQGVKKEEIIGFGDSENDLEFLQTVGYSVAMGNAVSKLKEIADEITADCDSDGVAQWIEKRIVGG